MSDTALLLLRRLQQAVRTFDLGIGRDADSAWEKVQAAEQSARDFLDGKEPVESLFDDDDFAIHAEGISDDTHEQWLVSTDVIADEDVGTAKIAALKEDQP